MDTSQYRDQSIHHEVTVSQSLVRFTLSHGLDVSHPYFGQSRWAYKGKFAAHRMYGQSKLAQMYHARSVRSLIEINIVNHSITQGAVTSSGGERRQCYGCQPSPRSRENGDNKVSQSEEQHHPLLTITMQISRGGAGPAGDQPHRGGH